MGGAAASSWSDERDLRAGHVIGPFELLGLVGRGGMARVWAARDQRNNQFFAVKMLRAHLAENEEFRKMFYDEARIASRIVHENVARTYELVELEGILTLVMELVDGPSLIRIVRPGSHERDEARRVAVPPRLSARIIAETCAGLHAAHELRDEASRPLGVVHRDVSPHNILVTSDGRVKITDFGVAKALGKSHQTLAGTIKGKLAYMSPEQLAGGAIDRRSDVFALGSLLYEMTVGQRAFDGENDPEIMRAILGGEPSPPSRIVRGYPAVLERIVMTALAPAASARWPTARHMQDALEAYLSGSGPPVGAVEIAALLNERTAPVPESTAIHHGPAPPPPPPMASIESGTRRRNVEQGTSWTLLFLAMVVGLVLGLAVLRSVYLARKGKTEPAPAPRSVPTAPSAGVLAAVPAGDSARVPFSPVSPAPHGNGSDASAGPAVSASASAVPRPAAPRPGRSSASGSTAPAVLPPNPYD